MSESIPTAANVQSKQRRKRLALLALAVAAGLAGWTGWWYGYARHYQTTDDAYVAGDVVQVTSEIAGTVTALDADDTQSVQRGQTLLALDPADAQVAMAAAQANQARAVRAVRTLNAQSGQLRAAIGEREAAFKRAQDDHERRARLVERGAVSREELAHAKDTMDELRAGVAAAREQLNATRVQLDGTTVSNHPQVLAAAAAVRDASLALQRTRIAAPVAGVVARRAVQVGQRVAPGTPLLSVERLSLTYGDKPVELRRGLYHTAAHHYRNELS